jgi:hypothetical protein
MKPPYESEIRAQLVRVLGGTLQAPDARSLRLPARDAHVSFRPQQGADPDPLAALDFGALYGAKLVERVRVVNGWLLFDLSPTFFSALVGEINRSCSVPELENDTHAENRMRLLSRHSGTGCPDIASFHRALMLALAAHESVAAYARAERAALSLFHEIPPRDRPALLSDCGALGGAMLRLLAF